MLGGGSEREEALIEKYIGFITVSLRLLCFAMIPPVTMERLALFTLRIAQGHAFQLLFTIEELETFSGGFSPSETVH